MFFFHELGKAKLQYHTHLLYYRGLRVAGLWQPTGPGQPGPAEFFSFTTAHDGLVQVYVSGNAAEGPLLDLDGLVRLCERRHARVAGGHSRLGEALDAFAEAPAGVVWFSTTRMFVVHNTWRHHHICVLVLLVPDGARSN